MRLRHLIGNPSRVSTLLQPLLSAIPLPGVRGFGGARPRYDRRAAESIENPSPSNSPGGSQYRTWRPKTLDAIHVATTAET